MAANLVNYRTASNGKLSLTLLSLLSREQRFYADDSKKKVNLYETLGIPSSSTQREIKKAYYDLTVKYHPDKNVNNEDAALKFREVSEAYEILGNYRSRKRYDRGLPISDVQNVIKHTVDHKSQYQEFFDSRSAKHSSSSDARMKEIDDLGSFSEKKSVEETTENLKTDKSYVVQTVFAVFIVVLCIFTRT